MFCVYLYNPNNDLNNKMFSVSGNIVLGDSSHTFKGRSRRLRPKAHISDDPLGNPHDGLKVLFWPPYRP